MPNESQSIPVAVGNYVVKFREEHKKTRDELEMVISLFGRETGLSSLANVENGKAAMTLAQLVVLTQALQKIAHAPISIPSLFTDEGIYELTESVTISGAELRALLAGDANAWLAPKKIGFGIDATIAGLMSEPSRRESLAERRAAQKLGVTAERLVGLTMEAWGESLDTMIQKSSGVGASAQEKGHVTRQLVEELRSFMESSERTATITPIRANDSGYLDDAVHGLDTAAGTDETQAEDD